MAYNGDESSVNDKVRDPEQPTEFDDAASASQRRVSEALLDARRELIDLSRRNRLLHTPRTGSRSHCLEIVGSDSDELFVALARKGKQFGFSASTGKEAVGVETEKPRLAGSARLETNLTHEKLEARLLKFFREARTFEEEQGVNILFIAIGFLTWFEDEKSDEPGLAPLLLIPVSLDRREGRDPFVIRGREDDIIFNVSLAEKLLGSFGILLPEIPDNEEWLPSTYFDAVVQAISGKERWKVDRVGVGLGFFTFAKFLMWRDLDASAWSSASKLLENVLLTKLVGEESASGGEIPRIPDEGPIDQIIDFSSAIHVVDADSSQAVCIEEVRSGRNLVIQGPPGTGKSQTIANIIATAAHAGKTVLFVAEKAAALEVVHSRLKKVGLDLLCLEIHSKKATKQSVISSLERSMRANYVTGLNNRNATELSVARDSLNNWSAALHREIRNSGRTPFQVMGTVLKLRSNGVRLIGQRLEAATGWNFDQINEAERAVERASAAVGKLETVPIQHPWYGTFGERLTPFDEERLKEALQEGQKRVGDLMAVSVKVGLILHVQPNLPFTVLQSFVGSLRLLALLPSIGRDVLEHPAWRSERERIAALVANGKHWSLLKTELAGIILEDAWTADIAPTRLAIVSHGKSLFRFLIGRYRRAIANLQSFCRDTAPAKIQDRLILLDKLISAQSAHRKINDEGEFGRAALGPLWASERTRWVDVEALLGWANAIEDKSGALDLFKLAKAMDSSECATLANELESTLAAFNIVFSRICEFVKPSINDVLGGIDPNRAALGSISAKLEAWNGALSDLCGWVSAREALGKLGSWKMGVLVEGLESGAIKPAEAKPMADLLIAEALWDCARSDDQSLERIDGNLRSEIVQRFRILDRKRLEFARAEVLARYFESKPTGESGEMAVIRAESAKKRRHLPIRKLMERAGSAVQKLKPIFLMSPLSVAQFVPPGRLNFDLIVLDEASQIPPEEALGAIARGRQMVIVGDDKQLPPTNFFRMVSPDEDDDQEEVPEPLARTRDFESILKLSRARGVPERMLRWHYRSRHPSLIAVSNHSCYGGELLLPPSPMVKNDQIGLSLVKTPRGHYDRGGSKRNAVEADLIAQAVEEHISKDSTRSLGIACFSIAQRDAVEDALQKRGVLSAAEAFCPKGERLFIKNLEAVQGDERDVIFISIGYGHDAQNHNTAGFGPVSRDGGERRLNVLISRARERCVVFSPITAGDIPADVKPRGTRMLREFLNFAETGHISPGEVSPAEFDSSFEEAVANAIQRNGYEVVPQVGVSGFRIDLGIIHPQEPGRFILGVECDGAAYHSSRSARDRDRLRQEVLENLGWTLYRIWSTDWFRSPDRQIELVLSAIRNALVGIGPKPDSEQPEIEKQPFNSLERYGLVKVARTKQPPITPQQVRTPPQSAENVQDDLSEPYQEHRLHLPPSLDLLTLPERDLLNIAEAVVRFEGPIHTEEVARRVREALRLGRTGRRILQTINGALQTLARRGNIIGEGEFWSIANIVRLKPRSRRHASPALRRPERIAAQEYRLAISVILRGSVAASKSELTAGVVRILGFERTGDGLERAISEQIDWMIASDQVVEIEGRLEIAA